MTASALQAANDMVYWSGSQASTGSAIFSLDLKLANPTPTVVYQHGSQDTITKFDTLDNTIYFIMNNKEVWMWNTARPASSASAIIAAPYNGLKGKHYFGLLGYGECTCV